MDLRKTCAVAALAAWLAALPLGAWAALTLRLSDGVGTVQVVDSDGDGIVNYNGAVGSTWRVNISTGLGSGALDGGMDVNTVNVGRAPAALSIALSEDGLSGAGPSALMVNTGGAADGSYAFALWVSSDNDLFGLGSKIYEGSASGVGGLEFTGGSIADQANPYSMTMLTTITHGRGRMVTSFDFEADVPEPASLALVVAGLLGLGAASHRRTA